MPNLNFAEAFSLNKKEKIMDQKQRQSGKANDLTRRKFMRDGAATTRPFWPELRLSLISPPVKNNTAPTATARNTV